MFIRSLLAALLLALSVPAAADFEVVSQAYEVPLADLRLPGTVNGTVSFRECETCTYQTVRATATTVYQVNGQALSLQDFQKELEGIQARGDVIATVLHHLESDTIEAIYVWF
ncbi:MAG TPA: hypothetical protein VFG91_13390 [Woeseiaceae bacterium]|nr:hypothetical protein [Woeseiaceae bacterium]